MLFSFIILFIVSNIKLYNLAGMIIIIALGSQLIYDYIILIINRMDNCLSMVNLKLKKFS